MELAPKPEKDVERQSFLSEFREYIRASSKHYDPVTLEILTYIVHYEPISLYKITRMLPYSISSIYKKAKRLMKGGLIVPLFLENPEDKRSKLVYEATVKGIITCWAFGCIKHSELLNKLMYRWNAKASEIKSLNAILSSLPKLINPNDVTILEDPLLSVLAVILFSKKDETGQAEAIRYFFSKLWSVISESSSDDIFIGSKKYLIGVSRSNEMVYVYSCKGCEKLCSMCAMPLNNVRCEVLLKALQKFN